MTLSNHHKGENSMSAEIELRRTHVAEKAAPGGFEKRHQQLLAAHLRSGGDAVASSWRTERAMPTRAEGLYRRPGRLRDAGAAN